MEMHLEYKIQITQLCEIFDKTKQSYYKRISYVYQEEVKGEILYQQVKKYRRLMPRIGGRKLYHLIKKELPKEMQIGRDKFFDWLRENNLLVKKRKIRVYTTNSHHWLHKHPYLLDNHTLTGINQLWVSDITYINTEQGIMYLFLTTDAWSKKIIGWELSNNMLAKNAIQALKKALRQWKSHNGKLIHHSDRGVQYCSEKYVNILQSNGIDISMTQDSNPLDNSIAERVNGILKNEWIYQTKLETQKQAIRYIRKIINIYNNKRPHMSLGMHTPDYYHQGQAEEPPKKLWKNYYRNKNEKHKVSSNEKV